MGLPRLLLFGDSLTARSLDFASRGWGSQLTSAYEGRADVQCRGYAGFNTRWCLHVLPKVSTSCRNFVSHSSARVLVVVWLGANDACLPTGDKAAYSVAIDEYKENLTQIVEEMKMAAGKEGRVILLTPPPIVEEQRLAFQIQKYGDRATGRCERSAEHTQKYAEACVQVGQATGTFTVDLHGMMARHKGGLHSLLSDGLHLSLLGNDFVFWALSQAIKLHWPAFSASALPRQHPAHDQIDPANPARAFMQFRSSAIVPPQASPPPSAQSVEAAVALLKKLKPDLGLTFRPGSTSARSAMQGCVIHKVAEGKSGDMAGLIPGDTVVQLGDESVFTTKDWDRAVAKRLQLGALLPLKFIRDGKLMAVQLIVGANNNVSLKQLVELLRVAGRPSGVNVLDNGIVVAPGGQVDGGTETERAERLFRSSIKAKKRLQTLKPFIGISFSVQKKTKKQSIGGLVVQRVDSDAAESGLVKGDVVQALQGHPVASAAQWDAELAKLSPGEEATMLVLRGPCLETISVTTSSPGMSAKMCAIIYRLATAPATLRLPGHMGQVQGDGQEGRRTDVHEAAPQRVAHADDRDGEGEEDEDDHHDDDDDDDDDDDVADDEGDQGDDENVSAFSFINAMDHEATAQHEEGAEADEVVETDGADGGGDSAKQPLASVGHWHVTQNDDDNDDDGGDGDGNDDGTAAHDVDEQADGAAVEENEGEEFLPFGHTKGDEAGDVDPADEGEDQDAESFEPFPEELEPNVEVDLAAEADADPEGTGEAEPHTNQSEGDAESEDEEPEPEPTDEAEETNTDTQAEEGEHQALEEGHAEEQAEPEEEDQAEEDATEDAAEDAAEDEAEEQVEEQAEEQVEEQAEEQAEEHVEADEAAEEQAEKPEGNDKVPPLSETERTQEDLHQRRVSLTSGFL